MEGLIKGDYDIDEASALFDSGNFFGAKLNTPAHDSYEESLADAKRPRNSTANLAKLSISEVSRLRHYHESIRSYNQAVLFASTSDLSREYSEALERAKEKVVDSYIRPGIDMPLHEMKARARAHDILLPQFSSPKEVYQTFSTHPSFGTEPKLRLLLIPESQTAPLTQHELIRGPGIDLAPEIATLLGCTVTESVMLYSEDLIAHVRLSSYFFEALALTLKQARGSPTGVGISRLHTLYKARMDGDAI
ncbi:hypothetical protein FB451DRAFT_1460238 [Mycena latifolia]|nr:hypothetical protein FB451DRAFT_1460238 [Mycena latifolia]